MTHQFPHPHATLPGHDPSKVRGYTVPDCITASASEALDVRVLKVAEIILRAAGAMVMRHGYSTATDELTDAANDLRAIAAEIRDAATSPRVSTDDRKSAAFAAVNLIFDATTEQDLASAWRAVNRPLMTLTIAERLTIVEMFITRMCVVTQDDGR